MSTSYAFIEKSRSEDGPLLLALLMGNNNMNNAPPAATPTVIADTLDPQNYALELRPSGSGDEVASDNDSSSTSGEDGFLVLQLANQNNNAAARDANNPIPDILGSRSVALGPTPMSRKADIEGGDGGPLLLGLQLANQNNNAAARGYPNPIPDTLDPNDSITEAIPSCYGDENSAQCCR